MPRTKKHPTWKSNGPIGKQLKEEMVENDYIKRGVTAAEVWKTNPLYQQFKLENFRTNFNKMKKNLANEQSNEKASSALEDLHDAFDGKQNL